jgi:hypothetical protein
MERDVNPTPVTDDARPPQRDPVVDLASVLHIRASDVEPFTGLRYLSKLFKVMAVILALLIISEVVTGLVAQGSAAVPTLLNEVSRLLVFSGLLWGAGDLAILLIDVGHDVRASRIMISRIAPHPDHAKAAEVEVGLPVVGERLVTSDIPREPAADLRGD